MTAQVHVSETGECAVLSSVFALVIQSLLFVLSFLTLGVKWKIETAQRPFPVFLRDSSKQIVGSVVIHIWNLLLAILFARGVEHADQCAWYWMNIMLDTTIGVFITYVFLKLSERIFGYDSGDYSSVALPWEHPALDEANEHEALLSRRQRTWAFQISTWCVVVSLMKCVIALIMWLGRKPLESLSISVTSSIPGGSGAKLIFVMVFTPIIMNVSQFWIQDNFLRWTQRETTLS